MMNKNFKFKIFLVAVLTVLSLFNFKPAYTKAAGPTYGHVLTGGVGNYGNNNRYYFITSYASSFASTISAAMNDWIYTTSRVGISTPISFLKTTNQPSSVIDIYYGAYYEQADGILGETLFYTSSTKINPYNSNWGWTKIQLNNPNFANLSSYNKKGTVAHEMGHAMGLAHNNSNPVSIMCQLSYDRMVNTAQEDDLKAINILY